MAEPHSGRYDSIARRWLALIERRQENFLDLCDSGRWRHYYTETEFLDEMRKVLRVREQWAALAGVALDADLLSPVGHEPPPDRRNGSGYDSDHSAHRLTPRPAMPMSQWAE
ncbi:MAG: TIGR03809 family protein [Xanthobacteraceae bacterium]